MPIFVYIQAYIAVPSHKKMSLIDQYYYLLLVLCNDYVHE